MESAVGDSSLGLTRGEVRLVPSDPAWPAVYERVAVELRAALDALAVAVEHIGATAVPGLPAKPILDVAIGLRADAGHDAVNDAVNDALHSLGFICRGVVDEDDGPSSMFGWEDVPRHRVVNLHLVRYDGRRWRAWAEFRDRLRADPGARDAYAALKGELARRFANDRQAYIAGKDEFVQEILRA
ncbi:MAG TPA: GrpB family protein [Kribbella sp.]